MQGTSFKSTKRESDGVSGVFERDEDTSYFYLYDGSLPDGEKILGAINVSERLQKVSETDISIIWNEDQTQVRLFCNSEIISFFRASAKT